VLGALLPRTGAVAFLGPAETAAVRVAVADVNAGGGVLDKPVRAYFADSGDISTDTASVSVQRLLARHVGAILPGAASAGTFSVIDDIVGAGVVMVSPTNSVSGLTDYADHGLYWRTAPTDRLQGRVLGETAVAAGARTLAFLTSSEVDGTIAANAERAFLGGGGVSVSTVPYKPEKASFDAAVTRLKKLDPEAIGVSGYAEVAQVAKEMVRQGLLPQRRSHKRIYFSDGNMIDGSNLFARGTLQGIEGTIPGAEPSPAMRRALRRADPQLADFTYAPEAYDAVVLLALAAVEAHSGLGPDLAAHLRDVSSGGVRCTSFATCKRLIDAGDDVDYDGGSGPVAFDEHGDPTVSTIGLYRYGADNRYANIGYTTNKD
ncbi:MAG: ABC transporter substrate-binding protein, partial [Actinomycetes bacterium]